MYVDVNIQHNYLSKLEIEDECPMVDLKLYSPARDEERKAKGKKLVQINESNNCYIESTHETKKSVSHLWYSGEELRRFKSKTAHLATQIVRGSRPFRNVSYVWCQALDHAYRTVKDEVLELLEEERVDFEESVLSHGEQFHLQSLYSGGEEIPLGMEHLIVEIIAFERHCRRDEAIDRIFHIEEAYRFPTSEMQEEAIRIASEALSITPRLFYRETAMALAAELKEEMAELKKEDDLSESSFSESSER